MPSEQAQGGQVGPPQSIPVSLPFLMPSKQGQGGQEPPQSTPGQNTQHEAQTRTVPKEAFHTCFIAVLDSIAA
jgi:hypothetical protein